MLYFWGFMQICLFVIFVRCSLFFFFSGNLFSVNDEILPSQLCFCINIAHYRWHLSNWQSCTKTCGKGSQSRSVVCRAKINDTHYKIESDSLCNATKKPLELRYCNEIKCPAYRTTHWSEVWDVTESVSWMCHYISIFLHPGNLGKKQLSSKS